jgi:hypothetical protein
MNTRPRLVIRAFAVLNIFLGVVGLLALLSSIYGQVRINPWDQNPPYFAQVYYLRCAINLVLVAGVIWAGPQLWLLRERGRRFCNILFSAQIGYFVVDVLIGVIRGFFQLGAPVSDVRRALGATAGTGNMGLGPQLIIVYPILALVLVNKAYGKLDRGKA